MSFKTKGIIEKIGDKQTTKLGTPYQYIVIEQEVEEEIKRIFTPVALGTKMELFSDLLPGDVCEVEFFIEGSTPLGNRAVIKNIIRL